ncbi:hypothetical protein BJX70DRAFT_282173 [Aspergillus crustosus]
MFLAFCFLTYAHTGIYTLPNFPCPCISRSLAQSVYWAVSPLSLLHPCAIHARLWRIWRVRRTRRGMVRHGMQKRALAIDILPSLSFSLTHLISLNLGYRV